MFLWVYSPETPSRRFIKRFSINGLNYLLIFLAVVPALFEDAWQSTDAARAAVTSR